MQEGIISKECDLGDLILSGDGKYIGLARTVRMHRILGDVLCIGLARTVRIHRILGDFSAKNTAHTPNINVYVGIWF